jgi:hypothetical protein
MASALGIAAVTGKTLGGLKTGLSLVEGVAPRRYQKLIGKYL